jgi:hypothetical protein
MGMVVSTDSKFIGILTRGLGSQSLHCGFFIWVALKACSNSVVRFLTSLPHLSVIYLHQVYYLVVLWCLD